MLLFFFSEFLSYFIFDTVHVNSAAQLGNPHVKHQILEIDNFMRTCEGLR
jgi:hypothetical protein